MKTNHAIYALFFASLMCGVGSLALVPRRHANVAPLSSAVVGSNEEAVVESGLGDISGGLETTMDYLPNFTPLERIAITATGNLQRIFSSYYNSPVTVSCVRNEEVVTTVSSQR
jgi:hypothetical protein